MKKKVLNIPFFSLSSFPVVFAITLVMVACGTGGGMGDGKESRNEKGGTHGTATFATAGFEDADQPYNPTVTRNNTKTQPGQVVKVDSTEARGNSRWGNDQTTSATKGRLDKTAGLRARYSLIGSKEGNRSRVGQSLRADNPERANEEILTIAN